MTSFPPGNCHVMVTASQRYTIGDVVNSSLLWLLQNLCHLYIEVVTKIVISLNSEIGNREALIKDDVMG